MKRFFSLLLALTLTWAAAACSNGGGQSSPTPSETGTGPEIQADSTAAPETAANSEEEQSENHILVAYFSWADNAVLAADVDTVASPSVVPPGDVQMLAEWVQEETGGDLFSIQVTEPYPSDWDECLARANQEHGDNARPELTEQVENLEQYDTVFLGYPNWWYGVPMALLTFLEENDLSGKQVYLFCSLEGWQTAWKSSPRPCRTPQSPTIFSIATKRMRLPPRKLLLAGLQGWNIDEEAEHEITC